MKALVFLLPLLLAGCEHFVTVKTVEVKVPVVVVPRPPEVIKPKLNTENVSVAKNGYDGFVKALESDMVLMNTYTNNLENIIQTYTRLSDQNPKEFKDGSQK